MAVSSGRSGLMACIIQHESSGNPDAVNGAYSGLGQWNQAAWEQDGGTRYAATPTGASANEQEAVLAGEGEAGQIQQQARWDGCA